MVKLRHVIVIVTFCLINGCASVSDHDTEPEAKEKKVQQENLRRHLVVQDALHFADTYSTRQQLIKSKRNPISRWWSEHKIEKESKKQKRQLAGCIDAALESGHISQHKICLKLYTLVFPHDEERRMQLSELVAMEKKRQTVSIEKPKQEPKTDKITRSIFSQQKKEDLKNRFENSISEEDFNSASNALKQIPQGVLSEKELMPMQHALESLREKKVSEGLKLGQHYYTQGNLNRALTIWQNTLELDPDNIILLKNIERVEIFMENLKQIRQVQSSAKL